MNIDTNKIEEKENEQKTVTYDNKIDNQGIDYLSNLKKEQLKSKTQEDAFDFVDKQIQDFL